MTEPSGPQFTTPSVQVRPIPFNQAELDDNFDRRIHRLEQLVTGSVMGSLTYVADGNFDGGEIIIGGHPIGIDPPPPVTGTIATPGTFFENIFCDVEWTEGVGGNDAVSFDVDLAERSAGPVYTLLNFFNTSGTNIRINNLEANKDYGVRVVPVNAIGVRGAPPSWVDFTTGADSTIPSAPTGILIVRGATSVVVKFTPPTDADVIWGHGTYRVQIDTANTFATGDFREMTTTAVVVAFNDIIGESPQWYARVAAIDSSGNQSAWSTVGGPSGPMGGVGDSMLLNDISAAHITVGVMDGDRINVNTLNANKIKTSSITAADITLAGGSFRAANPVPGASAGVLINSQGVRLYNTSGVATMILDASTGSASFTGSISASTITGGSITGGTITGGTITGAVFKTSASGERIEILGSAGAAAGRMDYYSGTVGEVLAGYVYFNHALLQIAPPILSGGSFPNESAIAQFTSGSGAQVFISAGYIGSDGCTLSLNKGSDATLQSASGIVYLDATTSAATNDFSVGGSLDVNSTTSTTSLQVSGGAEIHGNLQGHNSAYGGAFGGFAWVFLDYSGNAIYFDSGDIFQNGSFLKSFVIDHPLDPAKRLVHATLEGPEGGVYYRGSDRLIDGFCTVSLPDYFEALTHEHSRSVQLTMIAGPVRQGVLSATRVVDGKFSVFGSGSAAFWWEVKAIRKDVPLLDVEVLKSETKVHGDGPYTYLGDMR